MRNFPHQVNQIHKIRGALDIAAQLLAGGGDLSDDGVFGYAVASARIYAFRNLPSPFPEELEAAIRREQRKPASNQGPRTFARDLRRTMELLGFLEHRELGGWRITDLGQQVLALPNPPHPESTSLWVDAVINLSLSGPPGEGVIHPTRNIVRMVARATRLQKRWLAVAFAMTDDSDAELDRVMALQEGTFEEALQAAAASQYMAANAVKILPSLLEQLGLMSILGGSCTLTPAGLALAGVPPPPSRPPVAPRQARRGRAVIHAEDVPEHPVVAGRIRSTEDQLHTAALLEERTSQHQQLVRRVVQLLRNSRHVGDIRVSDDAFDIIAESQMRPELLLFEAKTIRDDALVQARIALGQLLFYEHFDVRPMAERRAIRKLVAFDNEPGEQVREFLGAYDVACLLVSPDVLRVPTEFEDYFATG